MEEVFKAVKVQKVSDEIVRQIIAHIAEGKLQPGDKLPSERELGRDARGGAFFITRGHDHT